MAILGSAHAAATPSSGRWLADDLVRRRRADDRDRYAASRRQARIDPNPHPIDAVICALRRFEDDGCILADEVGSAASRPIGRGAVVGDSPGRTSFDQNDPPRRIDIESEKRDPTARSGEQSPSRSPAATIAMGHPPSPQSVASGVASMGIVPMGIGP